MADHKCRFVYCLAYDLYRHNTHRFLPGVVRLYNLVQLDTEFYIRLEKAL